MKNVKVLLIIMFFMLFLVACKEKNTPDLDSEIGRYYLYVDGQKESNIWIELRVNDIWISSAYDTGRYELKATTLKLYSFEDNEEKLLYIANISDGIMTIDNDSLYAVYAKDGKYINNSTQEKYTITFDSSGGSSVSSITATRGSTINKPTDPTKDGYIFKGWYDFDGIVQWPYLLDNHVFFFANWEEITNIFNSPTNLRVDGSFLKWDWIDNSGLRPEGFEIYLDGILVSTQFTPQYELKELDSLWVNKTFEIEVHALSSIEGYTNGIAKLTYEYEIEIYDVILNYNDGTNRVETVQTNNGKISLPTPTRYGYQFNGWYYSIDGGQTYSSLWNSNLKVLKNISLYADWVTSVDGGSKTVLPAPQAVLDGTRVIWPAIPQANDYEILIIHNGIEIDGTYVSNPFFDFSEYLYNQNEEISNLTIKIRSTGDGGYTTVNSAFVTRYWQNNSSNSSILKINYDLGLIHWESDETVFDIELTTISGDLLDQVNQNKPEYLIPDYISADEYYLIVNDRKYKINYLMLAAPQHVSSEIEDDELVIHWDSVDEASQYLIYVNDIFIQTSYTNSVSINTNQIGQYIDNNYKHYDQNVINIRSQSNSGDYFVSLSSQIELETYRITLHLGDDYRLENGDDELMMTAIKDGLRQLDNDWYLEGFRFNGWYEDETLTHLVSQNTIVVHSNLHFYAKWEESTKDYYSITFHMNDEDYSYLGYFYEKINLSEVLGFNNFTITGVYRDEQYNDVYPVIENSILFTEDIDLYLKVIDGYWEFIETSDGYILDQAFTEAFDVVIPDAYFGQTVYMIASNAFYNYSNTNIESIVIPDSIVYIGNNAFRGLENLSSVTLPDNVSYIGYGAFDECSQLNYDLIDDNLRYLGNWLIGVEDKNVTVINLKEETVGIYNHALSEMEGLSSIYIPSSVTQIGSFAFYMTNVSTIEFAHDSNLIYINEYAFSKTSYLTSIQIPDSVEIIDSYAFKDSALNHVEFSENSLLKVIGEYAFSNTYVSSLSLPNHVEIDYLSLLDMAFLTHLVVSDNHTHYATIDNVVYSKDLESLLFYTNTGETSFVVPEGVKSISEHAFYQSELTQIILPTSLEHIEDYAFYQSESLSAIIIPMNVKTIGEYAFSENYALKSLSFANGSKLEVIGYKAFYHDDLTSVSIPLGVVSIETQAFSWNNRLNYVYIPISVTSIGSSAFNGSISLRIYTSHPNKPADWDNFWNSSNRPVQWGYVN